MYFLNGKFLVLSVRLVIISFDFVYLLLFIRVYEMFMNFALLIVLTAYSDECLRRPRNRV
jgi:hypothetical protein